MPCRPIEFEHQVRTGSDCIDDALAALGAVVAQDRLVTRLKVRHDLTERTSRCAPADVFRLEHGDVDACLGQMERGGEAGEAGTDDGNRDMAMVLQPFRRRRWRCGTDIDVGRPCKVERWFVHGTNDAARLR